LKPEEVRYSVRQVTGEIVRDQKGRLFESVAGSLRPLHKLMTGPRGELLEAEPMPVRRPSAPVEVQVPDGETPARSWRALLSEQGERRMVRLGDFKAQLLPQLAHPERLRDAHLLPCTVRLYEVTSAHRLEALAAAIDADSSSGARLQRLTAAAAHKLGLERWVRRPATPGAQSRGWLAAGERVFRLTVEQDPTSLEPSPTAAAPTQGPRVEIPGERVRAWEFVRTRDEVIGQLADGATLRNPIAAAWRWLKVMVALRGAIRTWQAACSGRSADEQLWEIRPPRDALRHPRVRAWAAATLERAGYDPRRMLLEWEIFWRRKGL
jgi:hypothetical protein